jgi:hypothetical protein
MERAKRSGGLHKRSAEAWGNPLRRAIGAEPLSGLLGEGRCGEGTAPLGWVVEAASTIGGAGRDPSPEMSLGLRREFFRHL